MKASAQHILEGKHSLLVGKREGLIICVCLGCGDFLGAARNLRLLLVLDGLHACVGQTGKLLSNQWSHT
jgi:hypothetical protein